MFNRVLVTPPTLRSETIVRSLQIQDNCLSLGLDDSHDELGSTVTVSGVTPEKQFNKISDLPISEIEYIH